LGEREHGLIGGAVTRDVGGDVSDDHASAVRTFLIADIRGYTTFTLERGDEAAARLAAKFAEVAEDAFEAHGGELVEFRGDEALAVFASARQALRAAVDLQAEFAAETEDDPMLPLLVGIGLDAGEAVRVGQGFRGGALNLAARLCDQAGAGEILASQGVVHLARAVEGIRYEPTGPLLLKGLGDSVPVVRVVAATKPQGPGMRVIAPREAVAVQAQLPEGLDTSSPLVGRDRELRRLRWAWRRARHGQGRMVVVAGPPGVGKARLAAELARYALTHEAGVIRVDATSDTAVEVLSSARGATGPQLVVVEELDAAPIPVLSEMAALAGDPGRPVLLLGTCRDVAASPALESFIGRADPLILSLSGPRQPIPEEVELDDDDDAEASNITWLELATGTRAFVGRESELQALKQAWSRAGQARRVLALLSGEPGIGKTTLAAQLARSVQLEGGLVLYGRWDEELLAPYQAFREALGSYARACRPAVLRHDLHEAAGEVSRLFPEVAERIGVSAAPLRGAAEAERFRLFEALDGWISSMAARRPVLIVLDDLHWADRPSLLLLQHLMRAPRATPLLVVATYRDTELDEGELGSFLPLLARDIDARRLALRGLGRPQALDLLERLTGRKAAGGEVQLAQDLQAETSGNPFFLLEILRHLQDVGALATGDRADRASGGEVEVPETVRDVIRWRLNRLPRECTEMLAVAAVLGQDFHVAVLSAAAGTPLDRLLSLLEDAAKTGLIAEASKDEDRYFFSHAVVRRVLSDGLSGPRRKRLHRAIAEALEALESPPATPAELAYHFGAAASTGVADRAVQYARLAGNQALDEAAYESAVYHYGQALELTDRFGDREAEPALRCELLLSLADAHGKAGEYQVRDMRFLEAADAARALGRIDLFVRAALGHGGMLPTAMRPNPRSLGLLEEALQRLDQTDTPLRARTLARLAHLLELERPYPERLIMSDASLGMARRLGDSPTLAAVIFHRAWALQGPDDLEEQLQIAPELLRLGRETGDDEAVLQALRIRLGALLERGEFDDACRTADELERLAQQSRHPEYLRIATMWNVIMASLEGRFDDAERMADALHVRLQQIGHPQAELTYVGETIGWRWLQGRAGEYVPIFEALEVGDPGTVTWPAAAAWCAAESGDMDRARAILDRLTPAAARSINRNYLWCVTVASMAHAAVFLRDREWAAVLYDEALPYAGQNCTVGVASFNGAVAYFLGSLAGVLDRYDEAARHLEAALERHASMGARAFVALTEQAYADVLARRGRRGDAARSAELLGASLATAAELGLRAAETRARLSG
jgi:class 3 adenylate cyclase/KaiC/GvpD/RAD55 family RecA-like ATPase/tetratricopeptide (TPR) repeat protein